MIASRKKRRKCGHCNELLMLPVYKRHKALYFEDKTGLWATSTESPPALKSDDETQCTASMQGFDCLEESLNTSSVLDYDEIASHHELINSSGMVHILYFPIIYIYIY